MVTVAWVAEAEKEADAIVFDGGNNDFPFFRPDLHIVVTDPHRAGNELTYHPGETNLRMADVVVINKVDRADARPREVENERRVAALLDHLAVLDDRELGAAHAGVTALPAGDHFEAHDAAILHTDFAKQFVAFFTRSC